VALTSCEKPLKRIKAAMAADNETTACGVYVHTPSLGRPWKVNGTFVKGLKKS
jgi:hypothetical protein